MKGTAGLQNLRVDCVIGVYDFEREGTQPVFVDLAGDYDWTGAVGGDDVALAVDYDGLAEVLNQVAQEGRFALLETYAVRAAEACLARFPTLNAVRLTLRKPQAVKAADCSFVEFELSR